ncbi:hypothetical protein PHLCEN_2v10966 [Hermanssonia centrifuga]|uniref:Uncharacterized protein n=1 Tax=Hermanssonia centrifuga TaxID=98765 RepID=A0A2R6NLC1_9APHY|nr:hypothetical protein PHLCEN_2v10966 [Hermanssonia centrifuga]
MAQRCSEAKIQGNGNNTTGMQNGGTVQRSVENLHGSGSWTGGQSQKLSGRVATPRSAIKAVAGEH